MIKIQFSFLARPISLLTKGLWAEFLSQTNKTFFPLLLLSMSKWHSFWKDKHNTIWFSFFPFFYNTMFHNTCIFNVCLKLQFCCRKTKRQKDIWKLIQADRQRGWKEYKAQRYHPPPLLCCHCYHFHCLLRHLSEHKNLGDIAVCVPN